MNKRPFFWLAQIVVVLALLAGCGTPPAPTPTPFVAQGIIHPGDQVGGMTITNEESKHFFSLLDLCTMNWSIEPKTQRIACTVPELAVTGIGQFWGAKSDLFESTWEPMTWELYLDDYQVKLDEFGSTDISYFDPSAGFDVTYRIWNVLLRNLTPGKHSLRSAFTLSQDVDDGWDIYVAGRYEYIYDLTVTEAEAYPSLPSSAEAGQHAYASSNGNGDGALDYLLYVPQSYGTDPAQKWPLIIYLHDAELRGTNPDLLRRDGLPKRLESLADFKFLVVSPVGNGDWEFWSTPEMGAAVLGVVDEIQSKYAVDPGRIYLTGAGMGGNGAWVMGMDHPERFAALAPLGGYTYPIGIPENLCALKDVPVWAFHGENDFMIPPQVEQDLVEALNACGGRAQITVMPGAVIPMEAYYNSELFDWLLAQSKE